MSNILLLSSPLIASNPQSKINAWQNGGSLVKIGGVAEADWTDTQNYGNVTLLNSAATICQDGEAEQIVVSVHATGALPWKFKVFRWNTGTSLYDLITEQTFTPAGTGDQTITLSPKIAVQMGDLPGLFVPNGATVDLGNQYVDGRNPMRRVIATDVTTSNDFVLGYDKPPLLRVLGKRPYLTVSGDSIMAGSSNGTVPWRSPLTLSSSDMPGGEPTSEPANQLRAKVGNGAILNYQNWSLGNQTYNWINTTGMAYCTALDPRIILLCCGHNDIDFARSWDDMQTDLLAIKAQLTGQQRLIITEILPATDFDDTEAALCRTRNGQLATFCAANNIMLVLCHDEMGQIRSSTGQLDDLKTSYNQGDNTHLSTAGVDAFATIIRRNI